MSKTGVLLVNLGTPDSYSVPDVRKYLRQFLMDGRVIDIPFIARFLLVNGIIAPFRAPKSAKVYKMVWMPEGSPLLVYGKQLVPLVQQQLGADFDVQLAMRYQNPSIASVLKPMLTQCYKKIIIVPLFPQYASATTGSVQQQVMEVLAKEQIIPQVHFISNYFNHPLFIKAFAEIGKKHMANTPFDHVIFSYHGLPERQIKKGDVTATCLANKDCCQTLHNHNYFCYRAQCFATSRLLAGELGLKEGDYTVCFQSRLGSDPWIQPYAEEVIKDLPKKGYKKVLAMVPSFVADCLETIEEVGEQYKELFLEHGGEHWQMAESLNTHPLWVNAIADLIKNNVGHHAAL